MRRVRIILFFKLFFFVVFFFLLGSPPADRCRKENTPARNRRSIVEEAAAPLISACAWTGVGGGWNNAGDARLSFSWWKDGREGGREGKTCNWSAVTKTHQILFLFSARITAGENVTETATSAECCAPCSEASLCLAFPDFSEDKYLYCAEAKAVSRVDPVFFFF